MTDFLCQWRILTQRQLAPERQIWGRENLEVFLGVVFILNVLLGAWVGRGSCFHCNHNSWCVDDSPLIHLKITYMSVNTSRTGVEMGLTVTSKVWQHLPLPQRQLIGSKTSLNVISSGGLNTTPTTPSFENNSGRKPAEFLSFCALLV